MAGLITNLNRPNDQFTMIENGFIRDSTLKPNAFRIGCYIASHAASFTLDQDRIARALGISRRTVVTAMAELEEAHYLVRHRTADARGYRTADDLLFSQVKLTEEQITSLSAESARGISARGKSAQPKKTTHKREDHLQEEDQGSRLASLVGPSAGKTPKEVTRTHAREAEPTEAVAPSEPVVLAEKDSRDREQLASVTAMRPAAGREPVTLEQPPGWTRFSTAALGGPLRQAVAQALKGSGLEQNATLWSFELEDMLRAGVKVGDTRTAIWVAIVERFGELTAVEIGATA